MLKSTKHGLQEKVQVSKGPEKSGKAEMQKLLCQCISYGLYV